LRSDPPLFLGIDFGTSGCRALVIDPAGETAARADVDLPPPDRPAPDWSEQDPDLWWVAVTQAMADLPRDTRAAVAAIAVDGTSGTLLLADRRGRPMGPALLYDDARARDQAQALAHLAPPDAAVHSPSSSLAKALWLLAGVRPAAGHLLHQADWVLGRLTGRFGTSDENNALKLGYDPVARCWPAWLGAIGLPAALLPVVQPVGSLVGPIATEATSELGLRPGTVAVAGTTDSTAGAIAAGVAATGDGVTTLGSTLVVKVLSDQPVFGARYGVYSHRLGNRWLVGGASNSGGAVLRQHFGDDELVALSAWIDPERPSPLDYYPLPRPGERFPVADPTLAPRLEPRPAGRAAFLHGLLEGMARIEALGYRRLAELGAPYPKRVLTTGGGAVNPTWTAIRARHLGVPVTAAEHRDAAYGAALVAHYGLTRGPMARTASATTPSFQLLQ
jgi:sugar (pentulose or hexulose) kinase